MNRYRFKILRLKNEVDRDMKKLSIEIRMATKEIDEFKKELVQFDEWGLVHKHAIPIKKAY